MLTVSALLVPFMVFLFWSIIMLAIGDKGKSQKYLTALLVIATIYFYVDAFYLAPDASHSDYEALVFLDILGQYFALGLPIAVLLYIYSLQGGGIKRWIVALMYSPSIFLGTASIVIYSLMGISTGADYLNAINTHGGCPPEYDGAIFRLHHILCQLTYNVALLTEVSVALIAIIYKLIAFNHEKFSIEKFLHKKSKVSPFVAECILFITLLCICIIRIGLGRSFLLRTPEMSAFFSILIGSTGLLAAYIGAFFSDRDFDLWDLQHPMTLRASETVTEIISTTPAEPETETKEPGPEPVPDPVPVPVRVKSPAPAQQTHKFNSLHEQFESYMTTQKPYLDPELNISDVAEAIHSNRTYISVLINENYEMTFRDYINKMRIEHAKQIMLKNPDEILEVIAERSGFGSDSQFAKKFKEIEGLSPKAWLSEILNSL